MKYIKAILVVIFVSTLVLTACAQGEVALQVTGKVAKEMGWTEDQIRKMDAVEVESTNKSGEVSTYTGVPIMALLDEAGINPGATTVVFVGDDGYTADVSLEELLACSDCIVSFRNQGGFSIVMPGFPGKLQIKGVLEIQIQ
jgi:hypothetical protein